MGAETYKLIKICGYFPPILAAEKTNYKMCKPIQHSVLENYMHQANRKYD